MPYDEEEREPLTAPDTENRTHFHAKDAEDYPRADGSEKQSERYKRQAQLNTGLWNGRWENKEQLHRQDNLARFDALSSALDLTDFQKERSRHLFDEFPLGTFGYSVDIVAFSICILVAEEDGREFDPAVNISSEEDLDDIEGDELFHEIALEQGYHYGRLETVINKIRDRMYKWNWK